MVIPSTIKLPDKLPDNLKSIQIIDLRYKIPVNPKYTWLSLKVARNIDDLDTIVFHHTGMAKSKSSSYDDVTWINRIAKAHISSTKNIPGGDPSIPYHALIRNGKLYILNELEAFTYGVASHNANTVHISVDGDYANHDTLTDQDRNALYAAYFLFKQWLPSFKQLLGHKELTPTSCPGYDMGKVRKDIAAIELEMSLTNTPNTVLSRIFSFHTRYQDLYNKAVNPKDPNQAAAQMKLLDIIQVAIDKGYYVP